MKREPQQLNERDRLESRIREAHKQMRQYNDTLKGFESHFKGGPRAAAEALLVVLPAQLEERRQYALSRFGVEPMADFSDSLWMRCSAKFATR